MTAMNATILNTCNNDPYIGGCGGYIGYSLCSKLFLYDNYDGINLPIFNALFPNVRKVNVLELATISDEFLNSIYLFLKENKNSDIKYIGLHATKGTNDTSDMELKGSLHQTKFKSIGFSVYVSKNDEQYGTHQLVLKKLN